MTIDGRAILLVLQWPSKGFTKDVVLNFVKYATSKMHCYRYLIGITRASMMQPGVSEHVRLQGIQTDDERSTAATASCPLSYEEQSPAN